MPRRMQFRTASPELQRLRILGEPNSATASPGLALAVSVLACAMLAGCQSLLPSGRDDTVVQWRSFEEARAAIEAIEPFHTTRAELSAQGIDPYKNSSVSLMSYPDVVQRFASGASVRPDQLDPGILNCLTSGKQCTGYSIAVRHMTRKRVGNFWADSFSFRRETVSTGYNFTATILFVGEYAVFAVYGGQPMLRERSVQRNPLGPLQGWGDALRIR